MTDSISRRKFIQASGIALGSTAVPAVSTVASAATARALASDPPEVTRQLANYVVNSTWGGIPEGVRYEAVRSVFQLGRLLSRRCAAPDDRARTRCAGRVFG